MPRSRASQEARAITSLAAVVLVAVLGAAVLWWSGFVRPWVAVPDGGSGFSSGGERRMEVEYRLHNSGIRDVAIAVAGADQPGLRPVDVQPASVRLRSGAHGTVTATYDVASPCPLPRGVRPLTVRVSTWWGTDEQAVPLSPLVRRNVQQRRIDMCELISRRRD